MLDIKFIRQNPDIVKTAAKNKKIAVDIDRLLELDEERRQLLTEIEQLNKQKNEIAKAASGGDAEQFRHQGKEIKDKIDATESKLQEIDQQFENLMLLVPNIPSADTPIGPDESSNQVVRQVGEKPQFDFEPLEHWQLGQNLDLIDSEHAAAVAGSRFAYLKGPLALLEFALIQHVLSILTSEKHLAKIAREAGLDVVSRPFIPVVPPVFIKPQVFQKMARLEPRDDRYYIPSDDLYLIGSAEHTLGSIHMGETLSLEQLPLRYVGFSTAFRREAGSYGKDTKGILRVHQFDKLELESFTTPTDSTAEQDLFVAIQEHILQSLGLAYQVVAICTGDMGGPDARQIDIETWMPGQNQYRETHTADLMTDYQARRLNTKFKNGQGKSEYVHMNDATAIAIGRTLIAIMENYQTKDGSITIPEVLRPYMMGITEIK